MKEYTTREKQGNEQRNLWDKRPGIDTVVREGEREGVGRTLRQKLPDWLLL